MQPPKDALDLYSWGVQYCEERGIPLSRIRIKWQDKPNKVWVFDPVSHWYVVKKERLGFILLFHSEDEAQRYGFNEQVPWIQPGHAFRLVAYRNNGVRLACKECGLRQAIDFKSDAERCFIMSQHEFVTSIIQPPPSMQLPACIKRHDMVQMRDPRTDKWRQRAICSECLFEKDIEDFYNKRIDRFPAEWIKSLGRCPGQAT